MGNALTRVRNIVIALAVVMMGTVYLAGPSAATGNGNNGTVKLENWTLDHGNQGGNGPGNENEPHVQCDFDVEWYGYDAGVTSQVTFEMQAPTADVQLSGTSPSQVQLDDDGADGANVDGLDATQHYTLAFDGDPQAEHGYHVKLTVETPDTNGRSDVKYKVFWVEPCQPEQPEQPQPKQVSEQHEACDLSGYGEFGAGTIEREGTQAYVWNDTKGEWVLGDQVVWGEWEFTPYTDAEYREECAPEQPQPKQVTEQHESCDLSKYGEFGAGTIERHGIQAYVWDDEKREWVLGDHVMWSEWEFTPYTEAQYDEKCAELPEQPQPKQVSEQHEACDLSGYGEFGAGTIEREGTQAYVWNDEKREWVLGDEVVWGEWEFTPYTDAEYREECAPEQPQPKQVSEQHESCDLSGYGEFGAGTIEREGTQAYVWDAQKREWVLGDEVVWGEWEFTPYTDDAFFENCAPGQPQAKHLDESVHGCDLSGYGEFGAGTIEREGTQAYVWDAQKREWVLGGQVVWGEWEFTPYTDQQYRDECAPEQPAPIVREVSGEDQSCDAGGVTRWTDVYTTEFVWDDASHSWVPGEETGPVRTDETFTEYTDDEYFELCAPPQPPDETREVAGVQASCHIGGQQTYTLTFTTEYVWDAETQEWVGEETGPVRTDGEFITYTPDQLKSCDKHGSHHQTPEPEVKGVQATAPAAVPTAVDAGLGTTGAPAGTSGGSPLWPLVVGAGIGLIGYAGARRRGEAG